MIFRSDRVAAHWDTWVYKHLDTYYLYYLITERGPGEGFGVATSKDGVHWQDHGWALRQSAENSHYLGTGAVWKAADFDDSGRFICNYSEHRRDANGRNIQNILFAWSTDLLCWTKFGADTMFRIDPEQYDPFGRWDCIFAFPRPEGGYWGTWTATGKQTQGIVGIGYSEDGLQWTALPPAVVDPPVEESGAIYPVGNRYWGMFGVDGAMRSYQAEEPTGPYLPPAKNAVFLRSGHTYFSRFLPTQGELLVNHHCISGVHLGAPANCPITYVAPFKLAQVDEEGVMRWYYWRGNEALKAAPISSESGELDFKTGVVIEGDVILPQIGQRPLSVRFAVGDRHYVLRVLPAGVLQMGVTDPSGSNWSTALQVDRECRLGATVLLRILARAGMMEVYLDEHFMECWTMGCHAAKTVAISCDDSRLTNLRMWQMSLEPAGAP